MKLMHFSSRHVASVYSVAQRASDDGGRIDKPQGFWLSNEADYGWKQWGEENSWPAGEFEHEVVLVDDANILTLDSVGALFKFTKDFAHNAYPALGIDWHRIATLYDGILIPQYIWSARLDPDVSWYYGWDCASGCIWNSSAVASITLVRRPLTEEEMQNAVLKFKEAVV